MHRLTHAAFREYGWLDPPSGALHESEDSIRDDLERTGGALALLDGHAVGCLRFDREPDRLHVRRVAIDPSHQGQGLGTRLMAWIHSYAHDQGCAEVRVGVRCQLARNQLFYQRLGYRVIAEHRHPGYAQITWVEMQRAV